MRYDCIVVGTGPAGLEAALNLQIRNKNFLLIGKKTLSDKVQKAPKVANYLGLPNMSGSQLSTAFNDHLATMDIALTSDRVTMIYPMGSYFNLTTTNNPDIIEASSIILAPGVYTSKAYQGEEEFLGRGVGYCATCDAPLYKGKKVVIVGSSKDSEEEANFVSEIASSVVFLPVGFTPTGLNSKIEVISGNVLEITGGMKADKLILSTGPVEADGIFILRDNIAPASLLPGLQTEGAHIAVDKNMKTNIDGCYAAGDCTGTPYQYIRAAGQGLIAAHSVVSYLAKTVSK